jgi:hypothetical protein
VTALWRRVRKASRLGYRPSTEKTGIRRRVLLLLQSNRRRGPGSTGRLAMQLRRRCWDGAHPSAVCAAAARPGPYGALALASVSSHDHDDVDAGGGGVTEADQKVQERRALAPPATPGGTFLSNCAACASEVAFRRTPRRPPSWLRRATRRGSLRSRPRATLPGWAAVPPASRLEAISDLREVRLSPRCVTLTPRIHHFFRKPRAAGSCMSRCGTASCDGPRRTRGHPALCFLPLLHISFFCAPSDTARGRAVAV